MKSIFDVFKDFYGKEHPFMNESPPCTIFHTGIPHKLNKNRMRSDLKLEQRMIVFRFLVAMDEAKELTTHDLIL